MEARLEWQCFDQLKRIADAQEKLLEIAQEAREERMKLSEAMRQKFSPGFTTEK